MSFLAGCMRTQGLALFQPCGMHALCALAGFPVHNSWCTPSCCCTVSNSSSCSMSTSTRSTAHQTTPLLQLQMRCLSTTADIRAPVDSFTASLQSKTEQDVLTLLQNARAAKLAEAAAAARAAAAAGGSAQGDALPHDEEAVAEAEDEDTVDVINPETGEVYGPSGKEPTRYGDWEIKGRCTDFN